MRAHAHVEDNIRRLNDSGANRFPFTDMGANRTWLAVVCMADSLVRWFPQLCLSGPLAVALTTVHGIQVRFVAPGGVVLHELCGEDATERAHGLSWEFDHGELTFAVVLQNNVDGVTSPTHVALPISLFPVPRAQPLTGS